MKAAATKRDPVGAPSPRAKPRRARLQVGQVQADHIATVAYYKAQARGFEPGREIEDWLEAEAELLKQSAG